MNAVLGLKECVCDLAELSWSMKAEVYIYINAVLGLKEYVCDLAELSWSMKVEL